MGKRIVIADTTPFQRAFLQDCLQKAGHEVVGATDSIAETMRLVAQQSPDIVITEIMLKESSPGNSRNTGIEMAETIVEQYPAITVLFCASTANYQVAETEIRESGAKGYIRKPFNPETVKRAVQDALNA